MLYDQGYFYGNMNDYGLKVHNSSVNNNAVFESLQKRKREFDDSLVSEYTDYSDICESFCYIGAIRINQGELNSRYSTLHHIFIPAEKTDINDPYTYIRYFYPYYYNSSKNLNEPLYQADIPKIPLNYNELLSFCMLDGKENRKRFAKLLELMYNVIFMEKTVAVVLPDKFFEISDLSPTMPQSPQNCYQIAAVLMLLLHIVVPDCFSKFNEIKDLRLRLKYSIVKNTSHKRGFCFISSTNAQSNIDCEVFDFHSKYDDFNTASFYYSMAGEVQKSPEALYDFLKEICTVAGVDKFSCRQSNTRHLAFNALLEAYEKSVPVRTIKNSEQLVTWNKYSDIINYHFPNTSQVYLKEYISHLVKFDGKGQIPSDEHLFGFWQQLKETGFDNPKDAIFIIDECRSIETLSAFIKDIINNKAVLSYFSIYEKSPFKRLIESISDEKDGLYALKKFAEIMKNAEYPDLLPYNEMAEDCIKNAKVLFENPDLRRDWLDALLDSKIWEKSALCKWVYDNIHISDNIEDIKKIKQRLNIKINYDILVWKKIFEISYGKFIECFEKDKNSNTVKNMYDCCSWVDICDSLSEYIEVPNSFYKSREESDIYYSQYSIEHSNSFDEINKYFSDNPKIQDCYFMRIGAIIDKDIKNLNEENKKDLQKIFVWVKLNENQFSSNSFFRILKKDDVHDAKKELIRKIVDEKDFSLLEFIDCINDEELEKNVWDSICVYDFPAVELQNYHLLQPLLHNVNTYLYDLYDNFDKDISGSIRKLKEKFRENSDELKENTKLFMDMYEVKEKCRNSKTSMKNYLYLAYLLDDEKVYRIIYHNFDGIIPESEKANNPDIITLQEYIYAYSYIKAWIEKKDSVTQLSDILYSVKLLGYKNLDNEEIRLFSQTMGYKVDRKFLDTEKAIFEKDTNISNAFEELEKRYTTYPETLGEYADITSLKKKSQKRLFNGISDVLLQDDIPYESKMEYIRCAEKLELIDSESKDLLRSLKADIEDSKNIQNENRQQSLLDILVKLQKHELRVTPNLWKKIQSLINKGINSLSFVEYYAGYELQKIFDNEKYDVSSVKEKYQKYNEYIMNDKSLKKFWWLYVECNGNIKYLREFWKNCDPFPITFEVLYDNLPREYHIAKMIQDIWQIIANENIKIITSPLFALYVIFQGIINKKYDYSEIDNCFSYVSHMIKNCTIISRVAFIDKNIEILKNVLIYIMEKNGEDLIESCSSNKISDIFKYYFECVNNAVEDSKGNTYIHKDIAKLAKTPVLRTFLNERKEEFLWGSMSKVYRNLPVFMNVLKIWIINDFIEKNDSGFIKNYKGKLAFSDSEKKLLNFIYDIYRKDDGTLMDYDTKSKLRNVFENDIFCLDNARRVGELSNLEKKYLYDIREVISEKKIMQTEPRVPREVKLLAEEVL